MSTYHIPALITQSVEGLEIKPNGIYADLTFGGGGHSREILARLNQSGRLIAFDKDETAKQNSIDDHRLIFICHNFRFIYNFLKYLKLLPIDGILADLGVSSYHFDNPERGFSFRFDGKLDMRMNQKSTITAQTVLNSYDEEKLTSLFKIYGEISSAKRLAQEIVRFRSEKPLETTTELKAIASKLAPSYDTARFLSQVFQALRIEVNSELLALAEMLQASVKVLKPGGRIAIISYHSLEDRMVKYFFRTGDIKRSEPETDIYGKTTTPFNVITRKVIVPSEDEINKNPRIRSAKLRIAEKF
ncbi:MAG: 16S rRNA (cytosine(1402)-N(4))-methyltransferase RsmH [Marinilabiliaceae bacterium]|nr:16S rRNA (cytosine(1402)-N(4))-methyltransferase RsmH [Marinilabiliaceae bacterium]